MTASEFLIASHPEALLPKDLPERSGLTCYEPGFLANNQGSWRKSRAGSNQV